MLKTLLPVLFLLGASSLYSQGLLVGWLPQAFTNTDGTPLAAGFLYQCKQSSSCPGTVQATYNSSSLSVQNANPMRLNGSGIATNDGTTVSGIWLTPGVGYSFTWTTASGSVVGSIDNIYGAITVAPSSLSPCGAAGQIQYYGSSTALGCSPNLNWDASNQVLNVTGMVGQAALRTLAGYQQSFGGFLSTVAGGGSWNGFNSPTDGALLRGYSLQQTTTNNSGGYIDIAPIGYNPYNGAQCIDVFGNVVQQPLPLNGLSGFGVNDSLLWVGTSPSMPSGGSCGAPLPVSPSQTYQGVPNQSFGLFTNSYFFARGGVATDNNAFNSLQALKGGAYLFLGVTTDQAVYPKAYASSTSLNNPSAGYGGLAYQGGNVYYFFNATTGTWNTVNLASGGGGGGSAQGPANAIQANDPSGAGMFTGYSWLLAVPGSQSLSALGGFTTTSGAGACTAYNCLQAPIGGLYAGLGVTADQAFYPKAFATTSGLNTPASGYGGFTYAGSSVGTGATYRYYNAMSAAWATVDLSTSGSGCTLGGTATGQILFNLSSACTSSSSLLWNNGTAQLTVGGGTSTTQSIVVSNGYGIANGGWNSGTCVLSTCIQAPNGGLLAGLGVTANQAFYPFGYSSSGSLNPPAFGYGGIGYTGTGLNYWIWNASTSAWTSVNLGSGGGGGACPGGGTNSIQYNNGTTNCAGSGNLTFNAGTNTMNLSGTFSILGTTAIDTSNRFVGPGGVNVTGPVVSAGVIQSTVASGVAFQVGSGVVQAFAAGNVNATNFNAASTSATFCSQTLTTFTNQNCNFIVNSSGAIYSASSATNAIQAPNGTILAANFTATSSAGNSIQTSGGASMTGGLTTGSSSNSTLYIGTGGNFYLRFISSSVGVSCSGVANGWMAVSNDGYIVFCGSGVRSRAALTIY